MFVPCKKRSKSLHITMISVMACINYQQKVIQLRDDNANNFGDSIAMSLTH